MMGIVRVSHPFDAEMIRIIITIKTIELIPLAPGVSWGLEEGEKLMHINSVFRMKSRSTCGEQ